ncbi:MAG: BPSS1780 family membrane protein [Gammaproteobacteria bacterium]
MSSPSFRLVFEGKIGQGRDPDEVKQVFGKMFGLAADEVEVLFSGKRAVLKRNLDERSAEGYRSKLAEIGAVCVVEAQAPADAVSGQREPPAKPAQDAGASGPGPGGISKPAGGVFATPSGGLYAPPGAALEVERGGPVDLHEPRRLSAGHGWAWIVEGFSIFKKDWLMWIAAFVVCMLLLMVLSFIPLVSIAVNFLFPIFLGGFMLGARASNAGGSFTVGHLFAGFDKHAGTLAGVGGLYLLGSIVVFIISIIVFFVVGGGAALLGTLADAQGGTGEQMMASGAAIFVLLFVLVFLALMLPLFMALWFAPALVVINDQRAWQSMMLSFKGCWLNIVPFLVFGLAGLGLSILALLTFGLAFFVLGPVITASMYAGYREIFLEN